MRESTHGMTFGCTTCWEVMQPCPCGDSECDLAYCSCKAAHVAANPPNNCECSQCPSLIPNGGSFCGMCRMNMRIDVVSVRPAKLRLTCAYHNTATMMEDK